MKLPLAFMGAIDCIYLLYIPVHFLLNGQVFFFDER